MKKLFFFLGIFAIVLLTAYRPPLFFPFNNTGNAELKSFGKPDEVREFLKGKVELIKIGGATIGELRWSLVGNGPLL